MDSCLPGHFTSRFIIHRGFVWYHDGAFTGASLINEDPLELVDNLSFRNSGSNTQAYTYLLVDSVE